MQPPSITVVVPVKDRRAMLLELLEALEAQTWRSFEVVIVDDGSRDGSGQFDANLTVGGGHPIVIRSGAVGAVRARNAGAAAASGEVLAFTDSDCRPEPGWLAAGVASLAGGADVVNGDTRPARALLPFERSMESGEEGLYPTCNVFYRREAFESLGGFDESLGQRWGFRWDRRARGDGFGEDTELAWRAIRGGYRVVHQPAAVVRHAVLPADPAEYLSRQVRVAAFPAMLRELPELRRSMLTRGCFLTGRDRRPFYLTVLALVVGRRELLAAGLTWWAAGRFIELRRYPIGRRRCLAALPVEMALDVVTGVSLAVGSARARTLVL